MPPHLRSVDKLSPGRRLGWGFSLRGAAVVRRRDWLIDKKIGSAIRMRRVNWDLMKPT